MRKVSVNYISQYDWLIIFIKSFLTQYHKIQDMIKYTVTVLLAKQQANKHKTHTRYSWWRHQMETFSALLAICAGNSPVPGEFPTQRPVTRSFDVYFDLRPNKRLSKQSWGWWFEALSCPLWRRRNVTKMHKIRPFGTSVNMKATTGELQKQRASWWRHQMETLSALLALCVGNSPVSGEFPSQRPVTRSSDVFFDVHLNKRLSKQSWGWWFETPSHPL